MDSGQREDTIHSSTMVLHATHRKYEFELIERKIILALDMMVG